MVKQAKEAGVNTEGLTLEILENINRKASNNPLENHPFNFPNRMTIDV